MDCHRTDASTPEGTADVSEPQVDNGRREALRRLGLYGAYTAPALVAMLNSAQAQTMSDVTGLLP